MRAVNAVGDGEWGQSAPVLASPTVPGVPTDVVGVPGDSSVAVSWTAPADGESPITASTVRVFVGDEQTPWNTFTVIGTDTSRADRQSDQWGGVSLRCAGRQQRGRWAGVGPLRAGGSDGCRRRRRRVWWVWRVRGPTEVSVSWTAPPSVPGDPLTGFEVQAAAASDPGAWG